MWRYSGWIASLVEILLALVERLASVKKRYPLTMPADWVHKSALALCYCSSLKKSKAHAGGRSAQRLGAVFG